MRFTALFLLVCNASFLGAQDIGQDSVSIYLRKAEQTYIHDSIIHYARLAQKKVSMYDPVQRLKAIHILAKAYNSKSEPDTAKLILQDGLEIAENEKLVKWKALCLLETGKAYQLSEEHEIALTCYLDAKRLFEKIGDKENLARTYVYLAEYYRNRAKFPEAKSHIAWALSLASGAGFEDALLVHMYNRAAAIKSQTGEGDSSLFYSQKAAELSRKMKNLHFEAISLNEIAFIYEAQNKLALAADFYKQAEDTWKTSGYLRYWANACENRARVLAKQGRDAESVGLYQALTPVAEKYGWLPILRGCYVKLQDYYIGKGDYKTAMVYQGKAADVAFKLFERENRKDIEEVQAKYETEKNKSLLLEKEKEAADAKTAFESKAGEARLFIMGTLALILFSGVLAYFYIRQRRTSRQLAQSLTEREALFKELHHRVKNNLAVLSGLLHLQEMHAKDEETVAVLQESQNRIISMRMIHELFYSQQGISEISFEEYVQNLLYSLQRSMVPPGKSVEINTDFIPMKLTMGKAVPLALTLNELFTNSFKYAFGERMRMRIGIRMKRVEEEYEINVWDDGPGLPEGFAISESPTLGLRLVEMLVSQVDGKVTYAKSEAPVFTIRLKP